MRFGRALFQIDTLIACVILAASLVPALRGYERIVNEQNRGGLFDQPVRTGSSSYRVLLQDKCIGFVTSSLIEETGTRVLTGDGAVRVRVNDELWRLALKIEANFNLLGQMGGGYIEMTTPRGQFTLAAMDINPVTVLIRLNNRERSFEHRLVIPGPFELRPVSMHSYRLHYAYFKGGGTFASLPQAFWDRLGLQVEPSDEVSLECNGAEGPAVDLNPLRNSMQSLAGRLKFLGPQAAHTEQSK